MNPKDSVGAKKAPLRYVPAALAIGASEAMDIGQRKYGPFNWREQPVSAMTYAEAVERHLAAWKDGQDLAEDTQVHHWKHIAASAAIILDALGIEGGLLDDRPTKGPAADLLRELDKSVSPSPSPREEMLSVGYTDAEIDNVKSIIVKSTEALTPYQEQEWIAAFINLHKPTYVDPPNALRDVLPDGYCVQCGQPTYGHSHLITCPAYGTE